MGNKPSQTVDASLTKNINEVINKIKDIKNELDKNIQDLESTQKKISKTPPSDFSDKKILDNDSNKDVSEVQAQAQVQAQVQRQKQELQTGQQISQQVAPQNITTSSFPIGGKKSYKIKNYNKLKRLTRKNLI